MNQKDLLRQIKPLSELTIRYNFMFTEVFRDRDLLTELLRRILPVNTFLPKRLPSRNSRLTMDTESAEYGLTFSVPAETICLIRKCRPKSMGNYLRGR